MNKLNIKKWKDFKVGDIFVTEIKKGKIQVPTGANVKKKDLDENGSIPRITVTDFNNGIEGYYDYKMKDNNYRVYENFISVSFLRTVFYHPYKASLDMKVHCLKLLNHEYNEWTGKFIVTILREIVGDGIYSDQISSTSIVDLKIKLPVDNDNNIDFKFMELYIKQLEEKSRKKYDAIKYILSSKVSCINTYKWKRFHLYDNRLFDIASGTKLDYVNMSTRNPIINFVCRSNDNNGVKGKVDLIKDIKPYNAGNLTIALGGEYLGSCFIQSEPFYTAQNINVLIPKWDMPLNVKRFIAIMIFKEGRTYYKAFVDELNRHIKTDFSILLPVDKNGNLDWKFMEKFYNKIENESIKKIDVLKKFINY